MIKGGENTAMDLGHSMGESGVGDDSNFRVDSGIGGERYEGWCNCAGFREENSQGGNRAAIIQMRTRRKK